MKRDFSWSGAVLAGFGVLRREPRVLLLWSLVGVVFGLADQLIAANTDIFQASSRAPAWMAPMAILLRSLIAVCAMAIFSAAVYRAVLRPEGEARGRMRFGADEVRLTLIWLLQGVLLLVLSIVAMLPAAAIAALTAKWSSTVTAVIGTVIAVGVLIFWVALLLRLSLAAPMALAEGRWSVPAAWRLTRGHAWKILAVHLPVLVGLAVVFNVSKVLYDLALGAIHVLPQVITGGGGATLSSAFAPARLGFTIIGAVLGAAGAAIFYAPGAAIYRDLKGEEPADQAAVFD
jgi:hypothetical protein